jgi:hypothetical protein
MGENVRRLLPALLVTTTAVTAFGTPALAAGSGGPTIQFANSVDGDVGRIQVGAASAAAITALTAHIVTSDTSAEVGSTSAFHLVSGTAENGLWRSDEVLLPNLGQYRLNVEADDAAGGHSVTNGLGSFNYSVQTYFDNLKTTPTITYAHRDYQISARLMGRWPGTGAIAPVVGMPVQALVPESLNFTDVVASGPKGQVSLSAPIDSLGGGTGFISTNDDPDHRFYLQGYSTLPEPTIKPAASKITVHLDKKTVVSNGEVTVSGDATWQSPDGWVPMANASVAVGVCSSTADLNCFSGPNTSTDATGHYSFVLNPSIGAAIRAAVNSPDPFIKSAVSAAAKITVQLPSSFTGFHAVRDTDTGDVYVGADALVETYYTPADSVVSVQFSKNGTTGWHTVADIDLGSNPGSFFGQEVAHPGPGYWRLAYAGDAGLHILPVKTDPAYVA